jgi:hypothetical protein
VLSQLAWFDEILLAGDPEIQALVSKGRGYDRADQEVLQRRERKAIGDVLQAYRAAADRCQIEISTSPFYHPILPLLCDTNVATEPSPGLHLPTRRFRHPEDVRLQLERSVALHSRLFGRAPAGLWPSEGSVSGEVLEICASMDFRWIASDQQVLSNSIGVPFYRDPSGVQVNGDRLYSFHGFPTASGEIRILFRDHELSDLIGFVYSRMDPEAAAADFLGRIKQSALPLLDQGKIPLVPIILDGENAWEYYPKNGRQFLRTLYGMLSEDSQVECLTVSEALERHPAVEALPRLSPGSWIDANFDIWIGAEEDNQAWDHLSDARDFFSEHQDSASPEQRALALEELLIAEGSDWCWWYGPEHSTANDGDFDALYRSHLSNVYRALNHRPPDALGKPIAVRRREAVSSPPSGIISPSIDGLVTNYFEWIGAGYYNLLQPGGAMHGGAALVREAYFGRNAESVFLRIDLDDGSLETLGGIRFRIVFRTTGQQAITVSFPAGGWGTAVSGEIRREGDAACLPASFGEAVLHKIFEMRVSLEAIGIGLNDPIDFQVSVWENDFPRETFPLEGWLTVPSLIVSPRSEANE